MCFSAEADFVAAAALAPIGLLTLRAAKHPRERLIAALPLGFALHQFTEGFVWLGDSGHVSSGVADAATTLYLLFAQVVLPALVPLAILLLEPQRRRRLIMYGALAIGWLTAVRFGWIIFAHDVAAHPENNAMVYRTDVHIGFWATLGYIIATCVPVILSSRPWLRWFGIVNTIGLVLAAVVRYEAVTSVWCIYAALVSGMILLHLRQERRLERARPGPNPALGSA